METTRLTRFYSAPSIVVYIMWDYHLIAMLNIDSAYWRQLPFNPPETIDDQELQQFIEDATRALVETE